MLYEVITVVAVVNASGITDELAERAWWASQTAENARCMLRQEAVVRGRMGPVLAEFLIVITSYSIHYTKLYDGGFQRHGGAAK